MITPLKIIVLWIGSAVGGWFTFWPWLIVPVAAFAFHAWRLTDNMAKAAERIGLPRGSQGTGMARANTQLVVWTFLQHLAIFGVAAGIHWVFS